uniref:Ribosomal RNA-processing protein 8 n=1 Tax=Anthurium amnicola TaxID=1678845 RepID=A0A1D1XY34_9ARAE
MEGGKRKPRRRGKRRRAEPPPAEQPTTPPAAPRQELQQQMEKRRQSFPEPKRRKCGGGPAFSPTPSSFLDKIRARLSGGHFRMLNEKLYTCSGSEAFELFKKNREFFDVYHAGYRQQMSRWPEQPVNVIIKWLQSHSPALIVADFGCGDACLARSVKNKVFSIDLVASDPSVIACDMANTPLHSSSVHVAVFCLSLMGINFPNYLVEATRVLRLHGWLLIAEVRSRFDPENGGADPENFCKAVHKLGFSLISKDLSSKMFVLFYFKKMKETSAEVKGIGWPELKPCLYKRR